ncbi:hypothetical protein A4R35_05950 [Thermogemmatispora tikiterensis]|uniref:Uncharacterized protein n=1 Tax=Thermogemmatispora tikiterensis TaxID=1825093 RepID=A0A328VE21_9CHLR|nr:hypothetical protein A4R35_05950 [Thermogemmatispora tikiterensis]
MQTPSEILLPVRAYAWPQMANLALSLFSYGPALLLSGQTRAPLTHLAGSEAIWHRRLLSRSLL